MRKVKLKITIERYIAVAELSTEVKGKVKSIPHGINREKEPINLTYIKILKHGLEHLTESVELTILVPPGYLYSSLQALEKWHKNGYITGKGTEVKYAEKWKAIHDILSEHIYKVKIKEKEKTKNDENR